MFFDGYDEKPSTKDHEYKRRFLRILKVSPDIQFDESKILIFDQQSFLANEKDKKKVIILLSEYLNHNGFFTIQASGDADTDIVSATLKVACNQHRSVAVAADDTDILCMLVYQLHIFFHIRS